MGRRSMLELPVVASRLGLKSIFIVAIEDERCIFCYFLNFVGFLWIYL